MASEPDIVEIYVDRTTKEVLIYIPAADMLTNGEDLPNDAIYIAQINLDDVVDQANILWFEEMRARL